MKRAEPTREPQLSHLPCLMTAAEVGLILGLSPKTIHKRVRTGKLACVQVTGRERRFTDEQVQGLFPGGERPGLAVRGRRNQAKRRQSAGHSRGAGP